MSASLKRVIALLGVIGAVVAGLLFTASAAGADPYGPVPTTTAPTTPTTSGSTTTSGSVTASNTATATTTPTVPTTAPTNPTTSASNGNVNGPTTLAVSDSTPPAASDLGVSGNGYGSFERVALVIHSAAAATLGTVTTDSKGSFATTVSLPAGYTGSHEIIGTGLTTGDVASAGIVIGGSGTAGAGGNNGGGSGTGGLSNTGVAVIGIGALGVVLLAGGGMLLLAGKRRRVHA